MVAAVAEQDDAIQEENHIRKESLTDVIVAVIQEKADDIVAKDNLILHIY